MGRNHNTRIAAAACVLLGFISDGFVGGFFAFEGSTELAESFFRLRAF